MGLALAIEDPWLAIVTFFETTARRQAADRGLYEVLAGQGSVEYLARRLAIVASLARLLVEIIEVRWVRYRPSIAATWTPCSPATARRSQRSQSSQPYTQMSSAR